MTPVPVCRWCAGAGGRVVVDLGQQVPSDAFAVPGGPRSVAHPLRLWRCAGCGLAQLPDHGPTPDEPRAVEPRALVDHAHDCVAAGLAQGWLRPGDTVREFGSPHGGSWAEPLRAAGLRPVEGRADVVVDVFGLMHEEDLAAATRDRVAAAREDGVVVLVFPPLETVVRQGQWYAVRHGHHTYPSTAFAVGSLAATGCGAVAVDLHPLYGGTTTVVTRRGGTPEVAAPPDVPEEDLAQLGRAVTDGAAALREHLDGARAAGRTVLGYGAASRAVPLLQAAGVGPELLRAVGDASTAKQGLLVPGTEIPVVPPEDVVAARPDLVVLFLPDLLPEVRRTMPGVEDAGGRWVPVSEFLVTGRTTATPARPD